MHPFFFIGIVHHAVLLAVLAFFVLFAASKADGFVKILGNVLGYLLLICVILWIIAIVAGPMFGIHSFGTMGFYDMHPGLGPHWVHPPMQPSAK
ncbi:MAG: hypothetical protein KGJ79_01705 [Alphaproteobacteria bacterium]|nr:hypothetical protein [Alphaproteobacteria bacterium]MDE2109828.1 hypothetical protein [Alphaproteobacteria bacterium]MDE2493512.1 hypothetical protein [Alphaproteobacteria bacterium]